MSITGFIRGNFRRLMIPWQQRGVLKQPGPASLARTEWSRSLRQPTEFYLDCFRFFKQRLPEELRAHREYFSRNRLGFNEDAMHVMWFLLFAEFQ